MGNDIETGRRERNTQLTYLVSYLDESVKQKQTIFMYCIKWFNMQVFIYIKNSEKKILYTNLYMANIV